MEQKEFNKIISEQIDLCNELLINKGQEYALTKDRLKSFKDAANLLNVSTKQALCGQLAKHIISIMDMCNAQIDFTDNKWSEKITDAINYLLLLKAIVIEDNKNKINREGAKDE